MIIKLNSVSYEIQMYQLKQFKIMSSAVKVHEKVTSAVLFVVTKTIDSMKEDKTI